MTTTTIEAVFREERVSDLAEEAMPLFRKHWQEIASYSDIPLEPDFDRYHQLETTGGLRIYTARLDKRLIGYAIFFLAAHAHYRSSLHATEDIIFLDPEFRKGRIGLNLIRFSDDQLKAEGVQVVHHHVKLGHPALGVILERLGYKPVETVFSKRLDR